MIDKIISKEEGLKLKGVYKFTRANIDFNDPVQAALHKEIERAQEFKKPYMHLVRKLNEICKVDIFEFSNIITTVGKTMIANNLTAVSPTNPMLMNYTSLGTGSTAVAAGDTQLQTEVFRKQTASYTNSANIAYATAFYTATETTGTYYEAGIFSNGTASANTGVLVSHVLLNPAAGITKSSAQTLTIDYTITIS